LYFVSFIIGIKISRLLIFFRISIKPKHLLLNLDLMDIPDINIIAAKEHDYFELDRIIVLCLEFLIYPITFYSIVKALICLNM